MTNMDLEHRKAIDLLNAGHSTEACSLLRAICARHPEDWRVRFSLGLAEERLGNPEGAVAAYHHAIGLEPDVPDVWYSLGVCYQKQGDFERAASAYRAVLEHKPEHFEASMNLAAALGSADRLDQAIKAFQQAVDLRPNDPEVGYRLALALEQTHRLKQAREVLAKILVYAPEHAACNLLLARLERRVGDIEAACKHLESIDTAGLTVEMTSKVHTEYGRVLEQRGDFGEAFTFYARAQESIHRTKEARSLRASGWLEHVARLRNQVTSERVANWSVEPIEDGQPPPVFIVGHPRSGTTLVEQVLGAHSRFTTNDERPILRAQVDHFRKSHGQDGWIAALDELSPDDVRSLRAAYREAGTVQVGDLPSDNRLIDKNPLNLVELVYVRRIFPEARVVMVLRDPRDVCLSCFTQLFRLNSAMAWFTSLDDTARHYAAVMDLWQHYQAVLGLAVFELRYEDFVADLETPARRMLEFLGEDWEAEVLQYHKQSSQRYISTPSYEGVTARPYTSSIGRWRNFSDPMLPVLPDLELFVDAFGY